MVEKTAKHQTRPCLVSNKISFIFGAKPVIQFENSYICSPLKDFMKEKIRIKNKRVSFEYFIAESLVAGIVLTGTEIKSIRQGKANLSDSYCAFRGMELFVQEMHIAEYSHGTYNNHEPKRDRKLLLNYRELKKLSTKVKEKGFTIVPLVLFIDDNGRAKLEIGLARGKHFYDKREDLKKKDTKREMDRLTKF